MRIVLTPFARARLFPREPRPNTIRDCTPETFEQRLNEEAPLQVLEGYAPFCKLHVHRNWTSTRCLTVPVTDDNRHLLRSAYEARSRAELPVLVRWFEGVEAPVAGYFVVILYSREQLAKEGAPIAMIGKALGVEEGVSGVPLDREAYRRIVALWANNANGRRYASRRGWISGDSLAHLACGGVELNGDVDHFLVDRDRATEMVA